MFGQDGGKFVPIGVMIIFIAAISRVFTALIIGKEMMLFKIGERSDGAMFDMDFNRSVNWKWSVDSASWVLGQEFSGCFEWNDYFSIQSSYEHWSALI